MSTPSHEISGDTRRAAALVVHHARGDVDGINHVLQEAAEADRITPLILAVLELYGTIMPHMHTPTGLALLSRFVAQVAAVEQ